MHRPKTVVVHHNRSSKRLERRVWFTDGFFWRSRGDGNLRDRRIKDMHRFGIVETGIFFGNDREWKKRPAPKKIQL
jgi:hypothetical protein